MTQPLFVYAQRLGMNVSIPECEILDKELWDFNKKQCTDLRKQLRERGFRLSHETWYHPKHWRIEENDWSKDDRTRYLVMNEAFVPLTPEAQVWLVEALKHT